MTSLRIALKQSLQDAGIDPNQNDDKSSSSEENEASLDDLAASESGEEEEEDDDDDEKEDNNKDDNNNNNNKSQKKVHHAASLQQQQDNNNNNTEEKHHRAAHKIQSQFRKNQNQNNDSNGGTTTTTTRTKKKLKKKKRLIIRNPKIKSIITDDNPDNNNNNNNNDARKRSDYDGHDDDDDDDSENNNSGSSDDDDDDEQESIPVPAPTYAVRNHMKHLPMGICRNTVTPGLRVKVVFDNEWYGGCVSAVSQDGSRIRIKYDDGTSEACQFPDGKYNNDIIIDDTNNGKHAHAVPIDAVQVFIPTTTTTNIIPTTSSITASSSENVIIMKKDIKKVIKKEKDEVKSSNNTTTTTTTISTNTNSNKDVTTTNNIKTLITSDDNGPSPAIPRKRPTTNSSEEPSIDKTEDVVVVKEKQVEKKEPEQVIQKMEIDDDDDDLEEGEEIEEEQLMKSKEKEEMKKNIIMKPKEKEEIKVISKPLKEKEEIKVVSKPLKEKEEIIKAMKPKEKEEIKAMKPKEKEEIKAMKPKENEEINISKLKEKEEIKVSKPKEKEEIKYSKPSEREEIKIDKKNIVEQKKQKIDIKQDTGGTSNQETQKTKSDTSKSKSENENQPEVKQPSLPLSLSASLQKPTLKVEDNKAKLDEKKRATSPPLSLSLKADKLNPVDDKVNVELQPPPLSPTVPATPPIDTTVAKSDNTYEEAAPFSPKSPIAAASPPTSATEKSPFLVDTPDMSPRGKRKRGRPRKQLNSEGVETEGDVPSGTDPPSESSDIVNAPSIPHLKIRMPGASKATKLTVKSPRGPRTPRNSPKKKKESLALKLDEPTTKKLSIRIPKLKVKESLNNQNQEGLQQFLDTATNEISSNKEQIATAPIIKNAPSVESQPKSHSNKNDIPSTKGTDAAPLSSPKSPKHMKKFKKKQRLAVQQADGSNNEGAGGANEKKTSTAPEKEGHATERRKSIGGGTKASHSNDSTQPSKKHRSQDEVMRKKKQAQAEGETAVGDDGGQAARSERRAAVEANERLSSQQQEPATASTNEQHVVALVKKKKKRKKEVIEGGSKPEGQPIVEDNIWVQCNACNKWRNIPGNVVKTLPEKWYCKDNIYDPTRASCDVPEQTAKQVAKEKKRSEKRNRKKQRLLEAAAAAEAAAARQNDEEKVQKGKSLEKVRSPRPQRDEGGKSSSKQRRPSPVDDSMSTDPQIEHRSKKDKKTSALGKRGRSVESVEKIGHSASADSSKPRPRGRPRRNATTKEAPPNASNQSKTTEAENLEWVQCEKCLKWRKLPPHVAADDLPDVWTCDMNDWNPSSANCDAPEDKAEGLQDIPNSGSGAGKLTYRNLIFGSTGRKANRPVSERTRAAESIFSVQFDEDDAPTKVLYADSSAFISRSRLNLPMDENETCSVLELMSHSHLWQELRGASQQSSGLSSASKLDKVQSHRPFEEYTFESLPVDHQTPVKELIIRVLDSSSTLSADDIVQQIKALKSDSISTSHQEAIPFCTKNVIVTGLYVLVKEGKVDCVQRFGNTWSMKDWDPRYRCARPVTTPSPVKSNACKSQREKPSRFMKISKPWKSEVSH